MSVRNRAGGVGDDLVVARLRALAPQLDGEPDPAWQSTTRARLVAMAAVRSPEPAALSPLRRLLADGPPTGDVAVAGRRRTRVTAGLAGAVLGITALATPVAVADAARPGDALYGLKRGTEQTQLALAGDARGEVLLDLAGTRLDEVRALADAGLVAGTLATMDAQTADGAAELTRRAVDGDDPGPLMLLAEWTVRQSDGLTGLQDDVPAAAADEVADSLDLLADLSTRVSGLRSSLDCADGRAVAGADELGPVPAPCASDGSTVRTPGQTGDGSAVAPGVPDPGSASAPAPSSGTSAPPAGGVAPEAPARPGDGGGPAPSVPSLPSRPVPSPPPVPLPVPTPPPVPGVPIPPPGGSPPLPGTAPAVPGLPGTVPTPVPPPPSDVEVCLPPIPIGGC